MSEILTTLGCFVGMAFVYGAFMVATIGAIGVISISLARSFRS